MGKLEIRDFAKADEIIPFDHGTSRVVRLAGAVVARDEHAPGWSWETHIRPVVGGESCQYHHRGYVVSGQFVVRTDEGEQARIGPDQVVDIQPGHVAWVDGDEPVVMVDWTGAIDWASPRTEGERILATMLFTDIVDSTVTARRLGDAAWRRELQLHDDTVRTVLRNYRGREIETAGDSFLAIFDGAARAVRAGLTLVAALGELDLRIRVGIHTGEVEFADEHLSGLAVHTAARVMARAGAGEVLVSSTTRELAEGSGLEFRSRGRHVLKGLEGERELFAAEAAAGAGTAPA